MNKWLIILLAAAICMALVFAVQVVTTSFGVVAGLILATVIFAGAVVVRLRA